ncbi:MAG TPA: hypothetical protein VGG63_14915 [Steroidobacteraceae bacterium]|jgi:hypothetical protein
MKLNEFNLDKVITLLRWPVAAFSAIYFLCMIVAPCIIGDWRWSYVQDVWDRWQGVNVGVLAFGASLIAFEITRYNESRQRKREFLAARAFLPEALSELSAYLKDSADLHMAAWNNSPQVTFPSVPSQYKHVFGNCIRHADSDTGEQLSALLSEILMWLQVHAARLESFIKNPAHTAGMKKINTLDGLRLVGELQARVNKLFDFARGIGEFDSRPLAWEDYQTAYRNLDLHIEGLVVGAFSLESKTKRHIERSNE